MQPLDGGNALLFLDAVTLEALERMIDWQMAYCNRNIRYSELG
jgi:hypothetical protein